MSRFVTQDRIKVTVSNMPGSWATVAGQEAERENVKLRPGAGEPKQVVHTQLEYGGRHGDPAVRRRHRRGAARPAEQG